MFSRNVLRSVQSVKYLALFNLEGTERIDNCQWMHLVRRWERFGGLAQLGERLPCKQEVSGPIPLISTKMGQQLSWLEHTTDNREVDGSSPFWPTISSKYALQIPRFTESETLPCKSTSPLQLKPASLGFQLVKRELAWLFRRKASPSLSTGD